MGTLIRGIGEIQQGSAAQIHAESIARPQRGIWWKLFSGVISVAKWIGMALLALLSGVLVLVPLVWGPMPLPVSVVFAVAWLGVLALLVIGRARFPQHHTMAGSALGFVTVVLVAITASQAFAYTPAIVDAEGKVVPGSIATLERVNLNGTEQWVSIRGKSLDSPVLLWLAGGPGGSQLATARYHLGALEDRFIVVNWEQPGSGKSFDVVDHSTLTPERYISDGYALVQHLKQRFSEDKVYLVGESWGSALGIWLVQRYPDQFHALVTTGQMVDFIETDIYDYNFTVNLAKERGDTAKVAQLEAQGPPPYYGGGVVMKQANYLLDGFNYMNSNPKIRQDDGFDTFKDILSPEYGLYDKASFVRGVFDSGDIIFPQLWKANVDFRRDAPKLGVPYYFFIGRHDVNAPPALAEEYYSLLNAPYKEWVWFERSGHNPWVTESDRFAREVVSKLLVNTPSTPYPHIALEPCTLAGGVKAECGTLSVFEDRRAMAGKRIDLRVAVIRARNVNALPDPVFFLAGGPGGAATEQWAGATQLFPGLHERRDIVLVDQRGTGGSNKLLCPPINEDVFSMSDEDAVKASLEYGRACMEELGDVAQFYTTNLAMDDLDDVRVALGYGQINLYGASYGATAAQVYLKQHGEHVRTVILDGGTLLDVPIFELMGKNRQRALELAFERCQNDPECAETFPNLRAEFEAVLEHLRREAVSTNVTDLLTGEPVSMTPSVLHGTLNWMLFSAGQVAGLPMAIHQAYNGSFDALAREYANSQRYITDTRRQLMFYSIVCNEGWARSSIEETANNSAGTYFENEEVGVATIMSQACGLVPRADLPPGFNEPVLSDVPVLLLVGEADPQDPVGNVADAPKELPNSLTVVVPAQGHTVVQYGCLGTLATEFVTEGTTKDLKTDCVEKVPIPGFKTRQPGW